MKKRTLVRKYQTENLSLHNTDCLKLLITLDDNSIDLIATDPPYFRVVAESWDRQWKNEADFFAWLDSVLEQMARVLKPTGSLYFFAGPHLANKVEIAVAKHFNMLNQIIWRKPSGRHNGCSKESLRRYFPQTEHIMFAESMKPVPFSFESIRAYLHQAIIDAGVTQKQVDNACGCKMSGHWFGKSQWSMIPENHYQTVEKLIGKKLKPYADLYAEYRSLLDESNAARRTFNVSKHVPYTNVWDFKPVPFYTGKHPCEKPMDLMEHIITASSLPGDVVLDAFVGGGSTPAACIKTGRGFVGSELGESEFDMAVKRLNLMSA
jgi:site-specific DNA-methyltransferase (adenine-specific)|tara:strand:+ start:34749 stop:35711 length:963 start_codon:yes stop_codon:yes gene_type:complete